tara:strand:+ start:577 stop:858 length:282 start_codon:yes stop_codon:yes gene_type:complete
MATTRKTNTKSPVKSAPADVSLKSEVESLKKAVAALKKEIASIKKPASGNDTPTQSKKSSSEDGLLREFVVRWVDSLKSSSGKRLLRKTRITK